jgi:ubiquinone/menaquinone biosynthesis C-methylase UbiE
MRNAVERAQEIWDAKAAWWDEIVADKYPVCGELVDKLLDVQPGMRVLEIACGNGIFSRRMARRGAEVLAADFSAAFLEAARVRTSPELASHIDYRLVDATDSKQLRSLGQPGEFDAALCSMGLMDMPEIEPLFDALNRLLRPRAPFVFSVSHPCFSQLGATKLMEHELQEDGTLAPAYAVKVRRYLSFKTGLGLGIEGEPRPHLYFERALNDLFRPGFERGFVVDRLEEIPGVLRKSSGPLAWGHLPDIPAFLVVRMRAANGRS